MQSVIKGGSPLNDKRCLTATLELEPSRQTVFLMFSFSGVAWRDGRGRPAPWPPTGAFSKHAFTLSLFISEIPCRGGEGLEKTSCKDEDPRTWTGQDCHG